MTLRRRVACGRTRQFVLRADYFEDIERDGLVG
jgi:hypothetical protein